MPSLHISILRIQYITLNDTIKQFCVLYLVTELATNVHVSSSFLQIFREVKCWSFRTKTRSSWTLRNLKPGLDKCWSFKTKTRSPWTLQNWKTRLELLQKVTMSVFTFCHIYALLVVLVVLRGTTSLDDLKICSTPDCPNEHIEVADEIAGTIHRYSKNAANFQEAKAPRSPTKDVEPRGDVNRQSPETIVTAQRQHPVNAVEEKIFWSATVEGAIPPGNYLVMLGIIVKTEFMYLKWWSKYNLKVI